MTNYFLSPEAQHSLRNIKAYSNKNVGPQRTQTTLQTIRHRMQALAENPSRTIRREDLKAGYHSDFVGPHTIYYRVQPAQLDSIDVLHQSMEPSKHI
jgi:toxin ParE1/3/4